MKERNILKSIIFLMVFIGLFSPLNYIMRGDKNECTAVAGFNKEKKDTIDVVFLGSSQVFVSIMPMEIWNDKHIRSYNLGASGTNIPTMYYLAKMAIRKQHPKVIIADMSFIYDSRKICGTERFHAVFDNFNFEIEKYEAMYNLVEKKDWYEMIFPLRIYHNGWKEINKNYFMNLDDKNCLKGCVLRDAVFPMEYTIKVTNEKRPISKITLKYIKKIITLCKKNEITLIFINMPLEIYSENNGFDSYLGYLNSLEELAKDNNIPFYNGYRDQILWGLDYKTDFCDPAHVNIKGAQKITKFVEIILDENNQNWRNNKKIDLIWDDQYIVFSKYYKKRIKSFNGFNKK